MKIIVLISVWKRLEITELVYKNFLRSIEHAKEHGIELIPFVIASENNHFQLAWKYEFWVLMTQNSPLTGKMNAGLYNTIYRSQELPFPDYIMTMDSDNVLDRKIWPVIAKYASAGENCFGFRVIRFMNWYTGETFIATYPKTCCAARCYKTSMLLETVKHNLWTGEYDSGMDDNAARHLESHGISIRALDGIFITDIKSDVNINKFETLKQSSVIQLHAEHQKEI